VHAPRVLPCAPSRNAPPSDDLGEGHPITLNPTRIRFHMFRRPPNTAREGACAAQKHGNQLLAT